MNALTYGDYFWIAIFTIGLYYGIKIVWIIIAFIIGITLKGKKDTEQRLSVYDLLEASHSEQVYMCQIKAELERDIEQGLIISYTIGEDFIVYRLKGGQKRLIDLSRYFVE